MREIKFRAWIKTWGMMGAVYNIEWGQNLDDETTGIISIAADDLGDVDTFPHNYSPEEVELLEYTGLKDKNGKEIYEGDILQTFPLQDIRFEVVSEWNTDETAWGWGLKVYSPKKFVYAMDKSVDRMEIIGNIYKNPELMERDERADRR